MKVKNNTILLIFLLLSIQEGVSQENIPYLKKIGNKTHLVVESKPFIVLGGELGNSSFTSIEYMKPQWEKFKAMNLNTILAPVYWELIEPKQGQFDFELLDKMVAETRKNNMKLIILWFGSWKNSMSSHVPSWIKKNQDKYPRAINERGVSQEILSPFNENNLNADINAFKKLMTHIRDIDQGQQTVIMVQPENEIGMLPSARDYNPLANELFRQKVPSELMGYLQENKENLVPEFFNVWKKNKFKTQGTWEEIFGQGYATDEIFMAWYFSQFTEALVKAGKEIYPLPMFVNAALIRPGKIPGEYPSAGPLPHLMDVWKAGAPSIDMLSPDFYNPDFEYWNDLYVRQDNPLFVPEHKFDNSVGAKAIFVIGHYEAVGFSPFSIESGLNSELAQAYSLINQLKPLLAANFGKNKIEGVLLDKDKILTTVVLGDYEFSFKNSYTLGWEAGAKDDVWDLGGALIIQTDNNEFYVAGSGVVITFKNWRKRDQIVGILKNEEGIFENDKWKVTRHLNGDQTHQGRHIRISHGDYSIQKFQLYEYD
ncbi:DUF5597 domain-containing protein [Flavimarina sp. Hel_I_48]|uniref:GH35 family beta-galactosidase n=1 Tax=Flavimarina sp. Hel_I_48 TaxID=1392488 RepID=UPI0004DF20CA|nr:DUF5597 domain-containing protein [Flavimarina sp. Hel_I_48]